MEQQEITAYAAITISGPLVYHLIRWNVRFPPAWVTRVIQPPTAICFLTCPLRK